MSNHAQYVRYNHNRNYENDGVIHIYITDFLLTGPNGELQPLLIDTADSDESFLLKGSLVSSVSSSDNQRKVQDAFSVNSYVVDFGRGDPQNTGAGFWMTGDDPDILFKLVYPAAPQYQKLARGVLDLASDRNLLRYYLHMFESQQYLQWTDFSLIDSDLGTSRNLLLSTQDRSLSLLKGTIKLNPTVYCSTGMPEFSDSSDLYNLKVQTYLAANYFVDFGKGPAGKDPEFWVEDMHHTWIKLLTPCHVSYRADLELTMKQTVRNVQGYNWAAEDEQIWRHVANFRLTDLTGAPHELEITSLNAHFILWGELVPPSRSTCPVIPIKLYVTTFSLDLGRDADDLNKGVWMGDVRGDWYKLVAPAHPDFRSIADPLFYKADKFLELYDALVYQDEKENISVYDDALEQYRCQCDIREVHEQANPKFDLAFVRDNADFVLTHLEVNFDLASSVRLVDSIFSLKDEITTLEKSASSASSSSRAASSPAVAQSSSALSGSKRQAQSDAAVEVPPKAQKVSSTPGVSAAATAASVAIGKGSASSAATSSSAVSTSAVANRPATGSAAAKPAPAVAKAASQPAPAPAPAAAPVVSKPIKKKQIEPIDTSSPVLSNGRKTVTDEVPSQARSAVTVHAPPQLPPSSVGTPRNAAADATQRVTDPSRRPSGPVADADLGIDTGWGERRVQGQTYSDGAFELCRFCKMLSKKDACRNRRHEDGKDVWFFYTARNPGPLVRQNSGGSASTAVSPSNDSRNRSEYTTVPVAIKNAQGQPTGVLASKPSSELAPVVPAPAELASTVDELPEHIRSVQDRIDSDAAASRANLVKQSWETVKDDVALEHARYEKRQKPRPADEEYLSNLFSTGSKTGASGFALPGAAARQLSSKQLAAVMPTAPSAGGLVRLGSRDVNPAQRMALTSRNAPGVFADSTSASSPRGDDLFAWSAYKHNPAAKPPKSALKKTSAVSEQFAAIAGALSATATSVSRLQWADGEGNGHLRLVKRYRIQEGEYRVDPDEINASMSTDGDE